MTNYRKIARVTDHAYLEARLTEQLYSWCATGASTPTRYFTSVTRADTDGCAAQCMDGNLEGSPKRFEDRYKLVVLWCPSGDVIVCREDVTHAVSAGGF